MKILRVASDLYPYVMGGIPIHVHKLSMEQAKNGHDVTVFTCIPKDSMVKPLDVPYKIVNFGRGINICGNTLCFNMLFSIFRHRHEYDVIDAHSHLYISTNLSALVRRLGSSPLIITNHGLRSQAVPKKFQEIYLKTVGRFTFNAADKVITFTEGEKQDMVEIGADEKRIVIVPNSIDTNEFYPVAGKKDASFSVVWIGRLCAGKGLKFAILAFEEFIRTFPDARLYIVGDGPYYDAAAAYLKEKHLTDNIILTGRVENKDMISYYNRSTVYLMSSMSEGMPRTLLEAMACEIPVVCTDIPQLVPLIQTGGIVIPKRDTAAIVSALTYLAENPKKCREFGKAGRKLIEETYSLAKMNAATEEVYRDALLREK